MADIQDLPKLAIDILNLARLAQNSVQELGELVNCSLPAEVAMSFPQRSGMVLSCSQQAEVVANFPRGSRKMLGPSQHVGILGNFLQKMGLSSLPLVRMAENFPWESSQGVASGVASSL